MKKLFVLTMLLITAVTASAKRDWKGKVVDEKGEPIAYANVAVLSKADSTVVCGAVTEEDGSFHIETKENDGIMMVAMLGYQTRFVTPVDGMVITLLDDAALLQGAAISVVMPKTKLTGEGLQTNVHGSVLENVGSAKDVLAKTPGVINGQNGLEVIGKGAPVVYINGRRMADASELDRLASNEIQNIEVITNPGPQYDATVRAVVRIRTVKRQGEGFGFSLNAADAQSLTWKKGNDPFADFNLNYRTGGVDIFAGVNYTHTTARQESDLVKNTYGVNKHILNDGYLLNEYEDSKLHGNAGVNWQISPYHSVGGKVEWGRQLTYNVDMIVKDHVFVDGEEADKLTTTSNETMYDKPTGTLGANLYYNGLVGGKLGIDVNLDYYGSDASNKFIANEISEITHNESVASASSNSNRMYAAKAVLSYPIWMGQLQAGTEESFSRRKDDYSTTMADIAAISSSSARVKEDNIAAFANYAFYVPAVGQLSAGVRYEHVNFSYEDAVNASANQSNHYNNWFPTVSYANAFGPVQVMFNYSTKTSRPSYSNLSSAIRYNSRYIWQSGNAMLQPEIIHNVGLTAVYKFMTLVVNYSRTNDAIMIWSSPYNDEGVVLVKPRNIETPYRTLQAFVNFTPTIGIWNLNYTIGLMPQWLTINAPDDREPSGYRETTFNGKPMFVAQMFNTFTFKNGWQLELGGELQTKGYIQNLYITRNYFDLSAAVQKSLLKDGSLILRLEGHDLAGLAHYDVQSDFGSHTIMQTNKMDSQRVKFSIRYNFNTAKSKYRGTGAGADEKARM